MERLRELLCLFFGHRWARWKGLRALRHPLPGQLIEIPAPMLIASVQGVYTLTGKIYCSRCLTVAPGRP